MKKLSISEILIPQVTFQNIGLRTTALNIGIISNTFFSGAEILISKRAKPQITD